MAFPSDQGTKEHDLDRAWRDARAVAGTIKAQAMQVRDLSAAGTLDAQTILAFSTALADGRQRLQTDANVPGIQEYAQNEINDPSLNITQEFVAMRNQIDSTISWIGSNFPKDTNNWLLAMTLTADGRMTYRVFSAAVTASLRTILDALIATID